MNEWWKPFLLAIIIFFGGITYVKVGEFWIESVEDSDSEEQISYMETQNETVTTVNANNSLVLVNPIINITETKSSAIQVNESLTVEDDSELVVVKAPLNTIKKIMLCVLLFTLCIGIAGILNAIKQ